ncbi:MAG: hypothetical protein IPM82_09875 [Saprospiraceae bacterium]|nr:hypothetical protein [Saprospiraceae bacterium]
MSIHVAENVPNGDYDAGGIDAQTATNKFEEAQQQAKTIRHPTYQVP